MEDFRAFKQDCRAMLHDAMASRVTCFLRGDPDNACSVDARLHTSKVEPDVLGQRGLATRTDTTPKLVFHVPFNSPAVYSPQKGDVIMLNKQEGFVVDNTDPRDGITITANCTRLSKSRYEIFAPLIGC